MLIYRSPLESSSFSSGIIYIISSTEHCKTLHILQSTSIDTCSSFPILPITFVVSHAFSRKFFSSCLSISNFQGFLYDTFIYIFSVYDLLLKKQKIYYKHNISHCIFQFYLKRSESTLFVKLVS